MIEAITATAAVAVIFLTFYGMPSATRDARAALHRRRVRQRIVSTARHAGVIKLDDRRSFRR